MNNCAFTICAKNYIGLAKILVDSFKEHNPHDDFIIFVVDELNDIEYIFDNFADIKIAKKTVSLTPEEWTDMSFKYKLTEFCTAIKPFCFDYLFNNAGYMNVVYLDPDIYIFNKFDSIYKDMEKYSIILTPHVLEIDYYNNDKNDLDELLHTGIFNLGFLALRNNENSKKMLSWWGKKLKNKCFMSVFDSQFTDQKWINFLPAFFDNSTVLISRNKGLNLAPWNFNERKIYLSDNIIWVGAREHDKSEAEQLVFAHFSGYDYPGFLENKIVQKNLPNLPIYNDINIILDIYVNAIKNHKSLLKSFFSLSYSYNSFDNGCSIENIHRKIYTGLMAKGEKIINPFFTDKNSYYCKLKKAGLIRKREESADKKSITSIPNVGRKLKILNIFFILLFKLIGSNHYQLLIRLLPRLSRFESQIFLVNKKYFSDSLYFR